MSIKCGSCGGRHNRIETVRQCAEDMKLPDFPPDSSTAIDLADLPSWCYSVLWKDGDCSVYEERFLRVKRVKAGRWSGTLFANWIGKDGTEIAMADPELRTMVMKAVCEDVGLAVMSFGTSLGICGHCGTNLSDDEPVCQEGRLQLFFYT